MEKAGGDMRTANYDWLRAPLCRLALAFIAGIIASPAVAQTSPPPRPPSVTANIGQHDLNAPGVSVMDLNKHGENTAFLPGRDTGGSMAAYEAVTKVAECHRSVRASLIRRILETEPGSADEDRAFRRPFRQVPNCGGKLTNVAEIQRGSWSEVMYLDEFEAAPAFPAKTAPEIAAFITAEEERNGGRAAFDKAMIGVADCLVAGDLPTADALLRSKHGGPEEAKLMDDLFKATPECAGAQRPQTVSRTFLRAFIADSLYSASQSGVLEGGA